jgi:hypothetical protein
MDVEKLFERPASMSNDIKSILERMTVLEGKTTPVNVKHGLNSQQKSVHQLPALFKPKSASPVLNSKKDPEHPMHGELVGDSVEPKQTALEEAMTDIEEDMVSKVKRDLDSLGQKVSDDGRRDSKQNHSDQLSKKEQIDRALKNNAADKQTDIAVKTYTMEDGAVIECHGDDKQGFELRSGGRAMPTKFRNTDDADMAVKIYQRRNSKQIDPGSDQDYIEER